MTSPSAPSSSPTTSVSVVIPVRGEHELLLGVLAALAAQETDGVSLDIVIVDDDPAGSVRVGSPARVLRSGGLGPYGARNLGWRATRSEILMFCDVRSRPAPTWVRRTVEAFADPAVALVGSEVRVVSGPTWGARASAAQQFFRLANYREIPGRPAFLPNCNLAVRRADLEDVGGYAEVRSGGDAELCWRILSRPGRRLATIDEVLMEWVPRHRFRGYLEQNFRYGRSHVQLRRRWDLPVSAPLPLWRLARRGVRVVLGLAVAGAARRGLENELIRAGDLANRAGVRSELRRKASAAGS